MKCPLPVSGSGLFDLLKLEYVEHEVRASPVQGEVVQIFDLDRRGCKPIVFDNPSVSFADSTTQGTPFGRLYTREPFDAVLTHRHTAI